MPLVRVHFLPELVDPAELAGSTCAVMDVLRATTTIAQALSAGAREVLPCLTIDDARALAKTLPAGQVVLGGERGGLPIAGFQLGNSPAEYTPAAVANKSVVMTTTNGTKALLHCRQASQVFAVALVNRAAVSRQLANKDRVDLVCAGSDGHVAQEDVLCAGAIVAALGADWHTNDAGAIARAVWRQVASDANGELMQRVLRAFGESRGGRNLIDVGLASDLPLAAALDSLEVVPAFDPAAGRITLLA